MGEGPCSLPEAWGGAKGGCRQWGTGSERLPGAPGGPRQAEGFDGLSCLSGARVS